jgi:small Trp-rich protein
MAFLILGIVLLAMKLGEFGPGAAWSWWLVLAPFGLAVLWWSFADSVGLTQRRAMDKMEAKKIERRDRNMEALGLVVRPGQKVRRVVADLPVASAGTSRRAAKDPTLVD